MNDLEISNGVSSHCLRPWSLCFGKGYFKLIIIILRIYETAWLNLFSKNQIN